MFTRILSQTPRFATFTFLAVLPVGVAMDEPAPGDLTMEVHGGGGQVITVIRDCEGKALSSQSHPFGEISGGIQYSRKADDSEARWVMGFRGGRVQLDRRSLEERYAPLRTRIYDYWNPHLAIEGPTVGFGAGYLGGNLPALFDDGLDNLRLSSHLRVGQLDHGHFLISLNESEPLLTGGGLWVIGGGYAPGERIRGFTGVSAGFHEGLGVAQRLEFAISDRLWLELGARLSSTESRFDGGGSVGLRYAIPTN